MGYVRLPQLLSFGVCDDIRLEQSGKLTLIGYYGRSIRVRLPAVFPKLAFFVATSYFTEPNVASVHLVSPSGIVLVAASNAQLLIAPDIPGIPPEYRQNVLFFQIVPMPLNEPGAYSLFLQLAGSPEQLQASFYVASI